MTDPKPGWKTTEFWISVSAQIASILVLLGLMSHTDSQTISQAVTEAVEAVGVLIANAVIILGYIKSRTNVKKCGEKI